MSQMNSAARQLSNIAKFDLPSNKIEGQKERGKVLVQVRVGQEAENRGLASKDGSINKVSLQGKAWLPLKERKHLDIAMLAKNPEYKEPIVDDVMNKLTVAFEQALYPQQLKLLEKGSFQGLNILIANNTDLNQQIEIRQGLDREIWQDFKEVVNKLAQYEKTNNLERYSDMPEVNVFNTDINSKLVSAMLKTLNEGREQIQFGLEDVQSFFNTLNKTLAANFDEVPFLSFNTKEGFEDLYKFINNEDRQRSINRSLLNKADYQKIFQVLLTSMQAVIAEESKATEQVSETSPILDEIKDAGVKRVLEILLPDIAAIKSVGDLQTALEEIEIFALNRTLFINGIEKDDFNNVIESLAAKSQAKKDLSLSNS
ncbi:MAG: hypothetical protein HRT47_02085 [Candidatus Caenarcaniphilales bacterium]|nr:hypothetical protein [Candidatus Caenarcaniphilales bacterium]